MAASAAIMAVGHFLSSSLGLFRETVVASIFGAPPEMSAFIVASRIPTMVYNLLLGGMISAALVPVLSEYAERNSPQELERLTSVLLTLVAALFCLVVLMLEAGAPLLAMLVGGGYEPRLLGLAMTLIRINLPSLLFFGMFGVSAAVLYARQQFTFPALAAAVYNLGTILMAAFLGRRLGIAAMSLGVVLGAFLQLLVTIPGLRGLHLRPCFDVHHPALRRIIRLYLPVIASILVAQLGISIDSNLTSHTVAQAAAWMAKATFFIQFPLGLVSAAIATAMLPALARISREPGNISFRSTLARGLRLVIVLIAPLAMGLLVLGQDGIRAVLEHGEFTPFDTGQVTRALLLYLPGLPFAAIDQPLVFAFYARKDTVTPVLVGITGVGVYLLLGPFLAFTLHLGFSGLVIANSAQLGLHCLIMWLLLQRRAGSLAGHGMLRTTIKVVAAAVAMGVTMWASRAVLYSLPWGHGKLQQVALLAGAGAAGGLVYTLVLVLLRVKEATALLGRLRLGIRAS